MGGIPTVAAPCLDSRSALRSLLVLPRAMVSSAKLYSGMGGYKEGGYVGAGILNLVMLLNLCTSSYHFNVVEEVVRSSKAKAFVSVLVRSCRIIYWCKVVANRESGALVKGRSSKTKVDDAEVFGEL